MSIQPQWKQKYDVLKNYIKTNPEIHIDMSEVSIPEHLRDKFYILFDDVRNAVIEAHYDSLPLELDTLCGNYIQSEKSLTELLGLERFEVPKDLSSFLHNPKEGLARVLYNRLFEVVQGKITTDDFDRIANSELTPTSEELFRLGYESWAALTLIRLLEPDRAFGVELDEDYEPFVVELEEIAFGRQFHHPAKRIPEFILHSKKLDRHVAVKMPLAREMDNYTIKSKKHTGDTSYVLDSRVMFLSARCPLPAARCSLPAVFPHALCLLKFLNSSIPEFLNSLIPNPQSEIRNLQSPSSLPWNTFDLFNVRLNSLQDSVSNCILVSRTRQPLLLPLVSDK